MIYQQLFDRVREPRVVRAGLIGCGSFGAAVVTQAGLVPRLELRVVADTNLAAATRAFRMAGVAEECIAVCDSARAALEALEAGKWVATEDALNLVDLPLDVIVTATCVPEAGARYAYEAIRHGKHVVFVDKEADSVVGPMLKRLADEAGVVFTTEDGDQPGLAIGLASWARALGFEVLCAGNFHELDYCADRGTLADPKSGQSVVVPADARWALERIPDGEVARYQEARRQLCDDFGLLSHSGDTYAHTVVLANGTGLPPDASGMHLPLVRLEELPEVLCPVGEGGVLQRPGCVELATILRTEGVPSVEGGVFVVVANADERGREVMVGKGLMANRAGTAMVIYRQHHLCGVETAMSILCAGLLGVPTGATAVQPVADIAVTATRDYKAGEVISAPGRSGRDRELLGRVTAATAVMEDGPLPMFLAEGNRLAADWPKGTVLTRRMVVAPQESVLWSLRARQDQAFVSRQRDGAS